MIGRGGMGEVYYAVDTTLDRPVALKIMNRGLITDEARNTIKKDLEMRFIREAKSAAQINHPNN